MSCTVDDQCDGNGQCQGFSIDCSSLDGPCQLGVCEESGSKTCLGVPRLAGVLCRNITSSNITCDDELHFGEYCDRAEFCSGADLLCPKDTGNRCDDNSKVVCQNSIEFEAQAATACVDKKCAPCGDLHANITVELSSVNTAILPFTEVGHYSVGKVASFLAAQEGCFTLISSALKLTRSEEILVIILVTYDEDSTPIDVMNNALNNGSLIESFRKTDSSELPWPAGPSSSAFAASTFVATVVTVSTTTPTVSESKTSSSSIFVIVGAAAGGIFLCCCFSWILFPQRQKQEAQTQ